MDRQRNRASQAGQLAWAGADSAAPDWGFGWGSSGDFAEGGRDLDMHVGVIRPGQVWAAAGMCDAAQDVYHNPGIWLS